MNGARFQGSPRFVSIEEAETLHETAVLQYGGSLGLRDRSALESAMAQAQQAFGGSFLHAWPFGMAAAYVYHIAKNHPFVDGNKRTGFAVCVAFLRMNGWNLDTSETAAEKFVLDVVTGTQTKDSAAEWLAANAKRRPSMELREFFASISYERFLAGYNAISPDAPGATQAQVVATLDECRRIVPFANELAAGLLQAQEAGDENQRIVALTALKTVGALYRIAEDMGYEW